MTAPSPDSAFTARSAAARGRGSGLGTPFGKNRPTLCSWGVFWDLPTARHLHTRTGHGAQEPEGRRVSGRHSG